MEVIPADKLLHCLSPDELDNCTEEEMLFLQKQVAITPNSSFPTHQRIHERAKYLYDRLAAIKVARDQQQEWKKWEASMFQKIHAHEDTMRVAQIQLKHQKLFSMLSAAIAVLAAISSAYFAAN